MAAFPVSAKARIRVRQRQRERHLSGDRRRGARLRPAPAPALVPYPGAPRRANACGHGRWPRRASPFPKACRRGTGMTMPACRWSAWVNIAGPAWRDGSRVRCCSGWSRSETDPVAIEEPISSVSARSMAALHNQASGWIPAGFVRAPRPGRRWPDGWSGQAAVLGAVLGSPDLHAGRAGADAGRARPAFTSHSRDSAGTRRPSA